MDTTLKPALAALLAIYLPVRSTDRNAPSAAQRPHEARLLALLEPFVGGALSRLCGTVDEDLLQEGLIAALDAARTYDPARPANFLTWVYRNVRLRTYHAWRRRQPMPNLVLALKARAAPIEEAWRRGHPGPMPAALLARELGEPPAAVERMRRFHARVAPLPEDWMDGAPRTIEDPDFAIDLARAIASLGNRRLREIARLCLVEGHSAVEVGMLLDIHPQKVQALLPLVRERLAARLPEYGSG